jgi:hypothetical protein
VFIDGKWPLPQGPVGERPGCDGPQHSIALLLGTRHSGVMGN